MNIFEKVNNYTIVDECHIWDGAINDVGYGVTKEFGKMWYTHRLMYSMFVSEIPEDITVHHKCHVRDCMNIDHLELATREENASDHSQKGVYAEACIYGHKKTLKPWGRNVCEECQRSWSKKYKRSKRGPLGE